MSPEKREILEEALRKSFDKNSLRVMLSNKMGIRLEDEVNTDQGLISIINELVNISENGEWTGQLLLAAYSYRPVNRIKDAITLLQDELKIIKQEPVVEFEKKPVLSLVNNQEIQTLEKIVNKRTSFVKFVDYIQKFKSIGSQICRIEFPEGEPKGTGWLVSSNLFLTNYHVMESILNHRVLPSQVVFRFGYFGDQGFEEEKIYKLATDKWLLDESKYALSDIGQSTIEPNFDELDYTLLKLDSDIGKDILPNGLERSWIKVSENQVIILPGDIVVVPQHPQGRSLELAFGNVLTENAYNSNGTRLRYNADTDNGSSGSPCFNIDLMPFGLHHSGKITSNISYNQCIPLREIIKRMKGNIDVPKFWINE